MWTNTMEFKSVSKNSYTWRIGDKLCSNYNKWNFKSNTNCKSQL